MQKLIQLKNKKGFTLIEMLIVILIIVILLAIAIPSVVAYREKSQETADLGAAKTVYTALEAALVDFGELPGLDAPPHVADSWYQTVTGTNIIYYHNIGNGTRVISSGVTPNGYKYAGIVNAQLGSEFYGCYKFGYDTTTSSIAWVSYHHDDNTINTTRYTAADSDVMVYDVANGISGYADELGSYTLANGTTIDYDEFPYTHD